MRVAGRERRSRGQAIQLGALLLFAILIINLSLFQIFVVPNQNTEIEFKHDQQVRSDMLDTRNAVLDAATGDQSFVEVGLAPTYPSRTLFVNPGQPAGTVRTTELQSITIVNDTTGDDTDISTEACPGTPQTRALEYRAGYNYYDRAPTYRIENTVLFRDFGTETLPGSGQQLVAENTINLLPLRNEFSESGTKAATVEPVPGGVLSTNVVDPRIELPTEFDEDTWEETLEGSVPEDEVSVSGGTLTLDLTGSFQLNCGPVGVNRAPPSGAREGGLLGTGSGGAGAGINPAGFSEVKLTDTVSNNPDTVTITLRNKDETAKSLIRGRIAFFYSDDGQEPTLAELNAEPDDELVIGADMEDIDSSIELAASDPTSTDDEEDLTFDFDDNLGNDFFVFEVIYDDGTRATYYVDVSKAGGGGGGGGGGTTSADQVSYGGGLSGTSGGQLTFDIDNGESDDVTVTDFAVADGTTSDTLVKGTGGESGAGGRELEITGGGTDGYANSASGFSTDGTTNPLDTSAVLGGSGSATVDLEVFEETNSAVDLSGASQVNGQGAADITVTLTFGDGSTKDLYFSLP